MHLHKRLIKTGIAVSLTMYILHRFKLEPAVFGAVSAILSLQPTISLTVKNALQQVKVQGLGILTGLILGYLLGGSPLTMGFAAMVIILGYNKIKLQSGVVMGVVAALFIISSPPEQFFSHALDRTLVIVTGLIVASVINVIIWPPRYEKILQEALQKTDLEAVTYFNHAISDFVHLDRLEIHDHNQELRNLKKLLSETKRYLGYLQEGSPEKDRAEAVYEYLRGISLKAESVYAIIPVRIERRKKQGDLPISEEFRVILNLLAKGSATIERVNENMRSILNNDNIRLEKEVISEEYWQELTQALEAWQNKVSTDDYVHAVIDIGVVSSELRWVSREGKKTFNILLEK